MDIIVRDKHNQTVNIGKKYAVEACYEQYPNTWQEWGRYKTVDSALTALRDLTKFYGKDRIIFRIKHKHYNISKSKENKIKRMVRYYKNLRVFLL